MAPTSLGHALGLLRPARGTDYVLLRAGCTALEGNQWSCSLQPDSRHVFTRRCLRLARRSCVRAAAGHWLRAHLEGGGESSSEEGEVITPRRSGPSDGSTADYSDANAAFLMQQAPTKGGKLLAKMRLRS